MLAGLILWGNSAWAQVPETQEQITLSYAPLVKQTAPAVVNIYTKTVVQERARNKLFSDPFFKQFFGDSLGLQLGEPKAKVKNSLGSGVIIDPDGTIVTNNHVIEGADQIRIVLPDRREFDATVVGADERTDLAVLHIETNGTPLPFIAFQDSDGLEVGDLVLAIGNPFGVGQTVTSGIVCPRSNTGGRCRCGFVHSNRCGYQSRKFGRCTGEYERQVGRHKHRYILELWWLTWYRVCCTK